MSTRVIGIMLSCCALLACEAAETDVRPAQLPKKELTPDALAAAWGKTPLFASGTRLRARLYELDDGVQYFDGFEDELLGASCSFERAEDGEMRCMPDGGGTFKSESSIQYSDSNCSEPVLAARRGSGSACPYPTLSISVKQWTQCGATTVHAYRVVQDIPPRPIYARSGESCVQESQPDCLFQLEHIEPSRFVRGTLRSEPADAELAVDWVDYADGARAALGMRDTTRDLRCGPIDGLRDRCVPDDADGYYAIYFADGACAKPSVVTKCADGGTRIAVKPATCTTAPTLFELGPAVPGSSFFVRNEGTCMSYPLGALGMYELGAAFHPSALPLLRHAYAGRGRLRIDYNFGPSGRPLAYDRSQSGIYDAVQGARCEFRAYSDGTVHCVPGDAQPRWSDGPYLDPECKDAAVPIYRQVGDCDGPPSVIMLVDPLAAIVEVRRVGSRVTPAPAELFDRSDRGCQAVTRPGPSVDYYRLGALLDLPAVSLHID